MAESDLKDDSKDGLVGEFDELGPDVRLSSGIPGLDHILQGGWPLNHVYLVQGTPGTGKTTLALQFLLAGARAGEPSLYVTLSETGRELKEIARSHGWSLKGVDVHQVINATQETPINGEYTLFHPSDVELTEALEGIMGAIDRARPRRVVLDSLSELRIMAADRLRYRRQVLALKQILVESQSTVLLLDDLAEADGNHLHSISHGVVRLEQVANEYGPDRRRMRVIKMRGVPFREGYHDYVIRGGGMTVFPRLVASEHNDHLPQNFVSSGLKDIDGLLNGGLNAGTSTVVLGPAGAGKTTLSSQYALAAAQRGEHSALFLFDESVQTFYARAAGLGMDIERYVKDGLIHVQQVDPAELSPGEFAHIVRHAVEEQQAKVIVIDSLNGYMHSMPAERYLLLQMHELLMYLDQKGVTSILVIAQHGLINPTLESPVDLSYLVDTVILMRFRQQAGVVGRAISVVKKRPGSHDHAIYEFALGKNTLKLLGRVSHLQPDGSAAHAMGNAIPSWDQTS